MAELKRRRVDNDPVMKVITNPVYQLAGRGIAFAIGIILILGLYIINEKMTAQNEINRSVTSTQKTIAETLQKVVGQMDTVQFRLDAQRKAIDGNTGDIRSIERRSERQP